VSRGPLVCLGVIQDASALEGWMHGIEEVADAVLALDLTSEPSTAERLSSNSLVREVSRARMDEPLGLACNRLLQLSATLRPGSILILTTDEQLVAEDIDPLRSFVQGDILPGVGYGFGLVREASGGIGYDLVGPTVYRLFSYVDGARLPVDATLQALIPTAIPSFRWMETTLRIRSTVGPVDGVPHDWDEADGVPGLVQPWIPRPPGLSVLTPRVSLLELDRSQQLELEQPLLSVIVAANEKGALETVASVQAQETEEQVEIVAVVSSGSTEGNALGDDVRIVTVPVGMPVDECFRSGLAASRGDYVLSLPVGSILLPGCLQGYLRAHERGFPIVAGTVLNGTGSRTGWASYFLEHSANLPGRPAGERAVPPPGCSFLRTVLPPVDLHQARKMDPGSPKQGSHRVWATDDARRIDPAPMSGNVVELLRGKFVQGMMKAASPRPDLYRPTAAGRAVARLGWLASIGPVELSRIDANVAQWGGEMWRLYRRARPLVAAALFSAWVGAWFGSAGSLLRQIRRSPWGPV
jgi:hypothetical protein